MAGPDAHARLPNYLGLRDDDLDRHIYRIMPVERLSQFFANRKNVLVRPAKWEDPFENFVLKSEAVLPGGERVTFAFNNDFYGQCWTLNSASDAMWRIYSPEKKGVRVRTTIKRLAESLAAGLGDWAHTQAFIGKVRYLRDAELLEFANTVLLDGLKPEALAATLLVKRKAFTHEREVRLLYFEKDGGTHDGLYSYEVNPHELVAQIMIDPRLADDDVSALTKKIRTETGFKGPILRSLLYAPPKGLVFPIG